MVLGAASAVQQTNSKIDFERNVSKEAGGENLITNTLSLAVMWRMSPTVSNHMRVLINNGYLDHGFWIKDISRAFIPLNVFARNGKGTAIR